MKKLSELVQIVNRKKLAKLELLTDSQIKKSSKLGEFYNGIQDMTFKSDRDAASFLYRSTPQSANYRKLKSRLYHRLLNTLLLVEPNKIFSTKSFEFSYLEMQKEQAQISTLMIYGAKEVASKMATKLLNRAQKLQVAEMIISSANVLSLYAAENGDRSSYENCNVLIKKYSTLFLLETEAKQLKEYVQTIYNSPKRFFDKNKAQVEKSCNDLLLLSQQNQSATINFNMFGAWVMYYELVGDYEALLETAIAAEHYMLENKLYFDRRKLLEFYISKMTSYLHHEDFKSAKSHAESVIKKFGGEGQLEMQFLEYYLLAALHSLHFIQAVAIYKRILSCDYFTKMETNEKEKWKLYYVYLHYVISSSDLDKILLKQVKFPSFSIRQFLEYKADKMNFPKILHASILIAQSLLMLEKKDYMGVNDKIDKLNYMADRLLAKKESFRMIQFIKLLTQLKKARYSINRLINADKYYNRLRGEKLEYHISDMNGLEIIPFEYLWEHLLETKN